jgi:hypothetical protein
LFDRRLFWLLFGGGLLVAAEAASGHSLSENNARFVESLAGPAVGAFTYLGAKHMVTGYDHLLFLVGVVFFLSRPRDIVIYVSLFTLGHSITLLLGVFERWQVNAYLIDAVIGLSVVYKAFENLGGFARLGRFHLNPRIAVFVFGLFHGLGLATKLQELALSEDGLVVNMLGFNVGVELGQMLALAFILLVLIRWRRSERFHSQAFAANVVVMTCGFVFTGYQLVGFFLQGVNS